MMGGRRECGLASNEVKDVTWCSTTDQKDPREPRESGPWRRKALYTCPAGPARGHIELTEVVWSVVGRYWETVVGGRLQVLA